MKKLLLLFSCFIVFFFILAPQAIADDDYAKTYQTYIDKTGLYQTAHNDYLTARSAYLASGSLDSKNKAMTATLKMLQTRDDLTVAYLTAIKVKVTKTDGVSAGDKSSLTSQLDTQIAWYTSHNTRLTSAGSLDDLVTDSDEAKDQYNKETLFLVYSDIISMGAGNNSFMRNELQNVISSLQSKIAEIKGNQDKDVSAIERAMVDIQNKLSRSQTKDDDAKNAINSIKATDQNKDTKFQDAELLLSDSNSYLKEATQNLLQIITQIKTN